MLSEPTDAKGDMAVKIGGRWGWGVGVVVCLLVFCLGVWLATITANPILGFPVTVVAVIMGALAGLSAYAISYRLLYQGDRKQTAPMAPIPTSV